jgi:hypothetical protein
VGDGSSADHLDSHDGTLHARRQARAALVTAMRELDKLREQITDAELHNRPTLDDVQAREPDAMQAVIDAIRALLAHPQRRQP